ncbi:MAG TPA: lysylphosphatidylglycerol synthase transmembrane domain-containing protein [Solirubrobacteraceae bacterium]|nr:lysylphosphatidylglycerol synthase transmembrane domain-containing protein [Solirubrobacteraceae bacterium]
MRRLGRHPVASSLLATALAAVAVVVIAHATKADTIGRAFASIDAPWIALVAAAQILTYPAYTLAYRSLAQVHGHAPPSLPIVARIVVAGFGPFALSGGFGVDRQALQALHEDERSARVRVMALGVLEWAVLAPLGCVVSIVLLASGPDIPVSLLWPWALCVPLGFGFALWAAAPCRLERLTWIGGRERVRLAEALEGIAAFRHLLANPLQHASAWIGTALYWVLDIASFYGALRTFGLQPDVGTVVIAYATGYAATRRSLPLGGAGVTEALMTYALYWCHLPLAPALGAVLVYRCFNFLLVAAPAVIAHRQLEPVLAAQPAKSKDVS